MGMIEAGTKVRFLKDITEPADGDHPEFLMATKGEEGTVVLFSDGRMYPLLVNTERDSNKTFWVAESECGVVS